MTPGGEVFRWDAPTRLCYAALAAYAFWRYAFGPVLALLRAELHFSYTLLGLYSALWSVGAAVAGVSFAAPARWLRRGALLWCSAAAATAGGVLVTASPYLLGSLADHLGLHTAFAIEPVLIGLCAVLLAGFRLARPPEGGIAPPRAARVIQRLESR